MLYTSDQLTHQVIPKTSWQNSVIWPIIGNRYQMYLCTIFIIKLTKCNSRRTKNHHHGETKTKISVRQTFGIWKDFHLKNNGQLLRWFFMFRSVIKPHLKSCQLLRKERTRLKILKKLSHSTRNGKNEPRAMDMMILIILWISTLHIILDNKINLGDIPGTPH